MKDRDGALSPGTSIMQPSGFVQKLERLISQGRGRLSDGSTVSIAAAGEDICGVLQAARIAQKKVLLAGNGGSAAIVSHLQNDLMKMTNTRAMCLHEVPLLTALTNDISYEEAFAWQIERWGEPGDVLIAVSSSGASKNIVAAVERAKSVGMFVVGISGFGEDNPLWLASHYGWHISSANYGEVEVCHQILCHWLSDTLAGTLASSNDNPALRAVG